MSCYRIKLIADNNPGCLERVLNNSRKGGFSVDDFSASLCSARNQYQIDLRISGQASKNLLIMQLLKESDVRSLTPCRS